MSVEYLKALVIRTRFRPTSSQERKYCWCDCMCNSSSTRYYKMRSSHTQYAVGEDEGKFWMLAMVLVSTRSSSLLIIHRLFLIFSHQGTFPRLYPRSAPDDLIWNNIISDPIQIPDAPQTFSPRNALQCHQTSSAPKFSFFFKFVFAWSVRLCFLLS